MKCLILVDLQYDFMPGGSLAVAGGDQVVSVANDLAPRFDLVVATQDWHPADHKSFASQHQGMAAGQTVDLNGTEQVLWPDHCVQGTRGAEFHEGLARDQIDHVIHKGTNPHIDSYSGFFDNGRQQATGLGQLLADQDVTEVAVMGLATDYCVMFTALDAAQLGFSTSLVEDGCRGVELEPGDIARAIDAMRQSQVRITSASHWRDMKTTAKNR